MKNIKKSNVSDKKQKINNESDDFSPLEKTASEGSEESLTALQKRLSELEKQRDEDRFIFLTIFIIFFNIIVLGALDSWALVGSVFILELFLLIVAGRRFRVLYIEYLLEKFLDIRKPSDPPDK